MRRLQRPAPELGASGSAAAVAKPATRTLHRRPWCRLYSHLARPTGQANDCRPLLLTTTRVVSLSSRPRATLWNATAVPTRRSTAPAPARTQGRTGSPSTYSLSGRSLWCLVGGSAASVQRELATRVHSMMPASARAPAAGTYSSMAAKKWPEADCDFLNRGKDSKDDCDFLSFLQSNPGSRFVQARASANAIGTRVACWSRRLWTCARRSAPPSVSSETTP